MGATARRATALPVARGPPAGPRRRGQPRADVSGDWEMFSPAGCRSPPRFAPRRVQSAAMPAESTSQVRASASSSCAVERKAAS